MKKKLWLGTITAIFLMGYVHIADKKRNYQTEKENKRIEKKEYQRAIVVQTIPQIDEKPLVIAPKKVRAKSSWMKKSLGHY